MAFDTADSNYYFFPSRYWCPDIFNVRQKIRIPGNQQSQAVGKSLKIYVSEVFVLDGDFPSNY